MPGTKPQHKPYGELKIYRHHVDEGTREVLGTVSVRLADRENISHCILQWIEAAVTGFPVQVEGTGRTLKLTVHIPLASDAEQFAGALTDWLISIARK